MPPIYVLVDMFSSINEMVEFQKSQGAEEKICVGRCRSNFSQCVEAGGLNRLRVRHFASDFYRT